MPLVATLVARGQQIHRVYLATHVTAYNPNYSDFTNAAGDLFAAAPQTGLALTNHIIRQQATMLAYNDVSWVFGLLFLCTIPMALFLPSRSVLRAYAEKNKHPSGHI